MLTGFGTCVFKNYIVRDFFEHLKLLMRLFALVPNDMLSF